MRGFKFRVQTLTLEQGVEAMKHYMEVSQAFGVMMDPAAVRPGFEGRMEGGC